MSEVYKINWQRLTRSALYTPEYPDRLLDDIRRETGKDTWTLQELKPLWARAAKSAETWGDFTRQEISRIKDAK